MKTIDIAFRIRKLREYRNYTQSYMAGKLAIKQNTYSLIESGAYELKPARLEMIAIVLDISVHRLLSEDFELYKTTRSETKKETPETPSSSGIILQMERVIKALEDDIKYLRDQNHQLLRTLRSGNALKSKSGTASMS